MPHYNGDPKGTIILTTTHILHPRSYILPDRRLATHESGYAALPPSTELLFEPPSGNLCGQGLGVRSLRVWGRVSGKGLAISGLGVEGVGSQNLLGGRKVIVEICRGKRLTEVYGAPYEVGCSL